MDYGASGTSQNNAGPPPARSSVRALARAGWRACLDAGQNAHPARLSGMAAETLRRRMRHDLLPSELRDPRHAHALGRPHEAPLGSVTVAPVHLERPRGPVVAGCVDPW